MSAGIRIILEILDQLRDLIDTAAVKVTPLFAINRTKIASLIRKGLIITDLLDELFHRFTFILGRIPVLGIRPVIPDLHVF